MNDRTVGALVSAAVTLGALGGFLLWFVILGVQFDAP